jgi:uncharacterized protein YndB with AHSA1/START domain
VTYSETINASPEQVWAVLSDVTRLPDWAYKERGQNYPLEGKYGGEQHSGVGTLWVGTSADGQTATQKVTVWEPPTRLVLELQTIENSVQPMSQVSTFELEEANGATVVTWTVDWQLTGGFSLSKILIWFTGGGTFEEMMAGSLENLKQMFQAR